MSTSRSSDVVVTLSLIARSWVRIPYTLPGLPASFNWIRILGYEPRDWKFESSRGYQARSVLPAARMAHCLCVGTGSIPVRSTIIPANFSLLDTSKPA